MIVLTVGVNSWVTVAEADSYFEAKYGAAGWTAFTADEKKQLLISAFRWIRSQTIFSIPASSTAQTVKDAQCEAAWFIYKYWTGLEDRRALYASGVRDFEISKFSETLEAQEFPAFIKDLLDGFTVSEGGAFPVVDRDFE